MIWFGELVLLYGLHLILKLEWIPCGIIGLFLFVMTFFHRKRYAEGKKQRRRFEEASIYMDQILYAFMKEEKVLLAFQSVEGCLGKGHLKDLVGRAIDHMQMTFDDSEVMEQALSMIGKEYACKRMTNIHDFMLHVEYFGGNIEEPVNLLLEDKKGWESGIRQTMKERKNAFIQVVGSVLASVGICGVILYLPVQGMDISREWIVQAVSVLVLILDDLIIFKAQKYLVVDYLSLDRLPNQESYAKKMHDYRNFDAKKERTMSLLYSLPFVILAGICIWRDRQWGLLLCLAALLVTANQGRIGRKLAERKLKEHISCAFPLWLLDLGLLLQSENLHVALEKSKQHVPLVLREELDLLLDRVSLDPESQKPFGKFLEDFDLPQVRSAMSMLYAISRGNSGQEQKQIASLVELNQKALQTEESRRLKDRTAGMYLLFLAPVLTASLKLLADMSVFLIGFLSAKLI